MNTQQLVAQFGALGVLIILAAVFGRWFLHRLDCEKQEWAKDRENERKERVAMTTGFLEALNNQNQLVKNDLSHMNEEFQQQQSEFRKMVDAIDRLCARLDRA